MPELRQAARLGEDINSRAANTEVRECGMALVGGGPSFIPQHQAKLEELLSEIPRKVTPGWHQTPWGVIAIALGTRSVGGLVVMMLTPR